MLDYEIKKLIDSGMSQQKTADMLGVSRGKVIRALKRINEGKVIIGENTLYSQLQQLLMRGATEEDLCLKLQVSKKVLQVALGELLESGYQIEEGSEGLKLRREVILQDINQHEAPWKGDKIIRFGVCSDNQLNSKYTQISHAHKLYDIYEEEGIKTVYHAGDLDEGEKMRPGHEYECYTQGADDHVEEIVKNYPQRKDIKTYFITGNHDLSIVKRAGYDIGPAISQKRSDMVYLGQNWATINLTPNCVLEVRHPGDGTAYAISYKLQKMIDAMSGGEKPNILVVGHYHKVEYLFYRNIHVYQTGCLQAQTPWMKGKQIAAMMGGWIIEAHVDGDGTVTRIKHEFIPFYYAIPDDYKNWR